MASFTTRDPMDGIPGTTTESNPYHYVSNDPLNKIDPKGLRQQDYDFDVQLTSSTSPDSCANDFDPYLPSESDLQAYGLSTGISAHDEHCAELRNVQEDRIDPSDKRSSAHEHFTGHPGSVGNATEQGAVCAAIAMKWNDWQACAVVIAMAPIADRLSDDLTGRAHDLSIRGPAGQNAVRHFAWLALVTAYFTANELWDQRGVDKARALTQIHEDYGPHCNGTPQECRWDNDADHNNNEKGVEFGQQIQGESNVAQRILEKANEYLLMKGQLDLRGGCPSRHLSVKKGC